MGFNFFFLKELSLEFQLLLFERALIRVLVRDFVRNLIGGLIWVSIRGF